MTLEEAKNVIYANVIYACEEAGFQPMTIKLVKDACDTVIALAEQADTPQTDRQRLEGKRWTDALTTEEKKCMLDALDLTDTPQTESTGSPIGDYRDGVGAWQTDCPWK